MATTQNTFNGNGSNLGPFSFTFKWLESTDIKVSVGGVLKTAGTHYNLQGLNYTTKTGGQVLFTAGNAPPVGTNNIRIYRDTDDEALSAVFSSGSAIRAKDLNDNFTQNLYVTQETNNNSLNVDGSNSMVGPLNMNGFQIDNLGEPSNGTDASTKAYVDSVVTNGNPYFTQTGSAIQRTWDSKLKDVVSVTDFGADPTGVGDSLAAIQAAAAAHTNLFFPSGTYKLSATLNLRGRGVLAENAKFVTTHTGITLILGGNSASGENPAQKVGVVEGGNIGTNVPTIRIIGSKHQQIWVQRATYIQLYADIDNTTLGFTADSCAYSSYWFTYIDKLEFETNPAPVAPGVQWINENIFYLNRIQQLRVAGTYPHNHNKFLYGSFEAGTISFEKGTDNRVEGLRGEDGCNITFAAGTANNVVHATWISSGSNYIYPGTVTDNGIGNHVGHERWKDNPQTTLTAFSYTSLQMYPNGTYNVRGVSNLSIGATSISATANQQFYDSGIIPCNKLSLVLKARVLGLISGGYRSIIDGYDSAKNVITPTAADVVVIGSGNHPFGGFSFQNATGCVDDLVAYPINSNTRYIRIRFVAGPSGFNAEGFVAALRYNNDDIAFLGAQAAAGTNAPLVPSIQTLSKKLTLSDNVQSTLFTFGIPAVSQSTHNVSFGFEVSYVIRVSRDSSSRFWEAVYGKVYGAISRGWENNSAAEPFISINTTDQSLIQTPGTWVPTITWAVAKDSGIDSAFKNAYLRITVDNTIPAVNNTAISATINWNVGGGNGELTNVTIT